MCWMISPCLPRNDGKPKTDWRIKRAWVTLPITHRAPEKLLEVPAADFARRVGKQALLRVRALRERRDVALAVAQSGDAVRDPGRVHQLDEMSREHFASVFRGRAARVRAEPRGAFQVALGTGFGGEAEHRGRIDDHRHSVR